MKSPNCISTMGWKPSRARPRAQPSAPDSMIGVLRTRSLPNSATNPSVTLKAPPYSAMSWPSSTTRSSARMASRNPSEMASRYRRSAAGPGGGPAPPPPPPARSRPPPLRPPPRQAGVAADARPAHAVTGRPVGRAAAGVLPRRRRREPPAVVLPHEDHRQPPHGRQVEGLVEVALAGAAVAGEDGGDPGLATQPAGQGQAVGHRQHGAEVADHPDDAVLEGAEVEAAVAPGGEAALAAQQLAQEPVEVDAPGREDSQVAGQRQDDAPV